MFRGDSHSARPPNDRTQENRWLSDGLLGIHEPSRAAEKVHERSRIVIDMLAHLKADPDPDRGETEQDTGAALQRSQLGSLRITTRTSEPAARAASRGARSGRPPGLWEHFGRGIPAWSMTLAVGRRHSYVTRQDNLGYPSITARHAGYSILPRDSGL